MLVMSPFIQKICISLYVVITISDSNVERKGLFVTYETTIVSNSQMQLMFIEYTYMELLCFTRHNMIDKLFLSFSDNVSV